MLIAIDFLKLAEALGFIARKLELSRQPEPPPIPAELAPRACTPHRCKTMWGTPICFWDAPKQTRRQMARERGTKEYVEEYYRERCLDSIARGAFCISASLVVCVLAPRDFEVKRLRETAVGHMTWTSPEEVFQRCWAHIVMMRMPKLLACNKQHTPDNALNKQHNSDAYNYLYYTHKTAPYKAVILPCFSILSHRIFPTHHCISLPQQESSDRSIPFRILYMCTESAFTCVLK